MSTPQAVKGPRINKGLVIVNTGEGKGKTTAAFGVLFRAWGRDMKVRMFQFIKHTGARYGEIRAAEKVGILVEALGDGFTWLSKDLERSKALAVEQWENAKAAILAGEEDVIALDEFTYQLHHGRVLAAVPPLTFVEVHKDGVGGVDGLDDLRWVTLSPDGQHLYAAGGLDDAVAVFSRNATTGTLGFVEFKQNGVGGVSGLDGIVFVTVSPDGKHVYTAATNDNAVAVFSRNATTGALTFVEFKQDGVAGVDGLQQARSVIVSPDGKHVYASSSIDNAVAVFSRNATTGALSFVEVHKDGVLGVDGLANSRSVTISLDGKHVYASGVSDDAIAVFSRNATTGALTFVEVHKDGVLGVDGLDVALVVDVSPVGKNVYVTGTDDNAVAVFSRNATTGALTFLEVKKDGVSGVDGLGGANPVRVSPNGLFVFVGGQTDDAVAVFSRSATTGALTFVEVIKDGVGGVDGLDGTIGIATSADEKHLYVGGGIDDAVAVFAGTPAPDLSIAKSANPAIAVVAQGLTYTLTVTNNGPSTATSVVVTDTLPGTVTYVSTSAGCSESGGTVTCTAASLANGANVVFTITVIAPILLGDISNTASVTSNTTDLTPSNDSITLVIPVIPPPAVPGVSTWGLGVLALGLVAAVLFMRRRSMRTASQ
ncbi:MAG: beta-propeller fold lactonase family protein [Chloroflexi bacterium]|nr:beta-propeller fold lactonase family protein [Chloroflexota bacterium]